MLGRTLLYSKTDIAGLLSETRSLVLGRGNTLVCCLQSVRRLGEQVGGNVIVSLGSRGASWYETYRLTSQDLKHLAKPNPTPIRSKNASRCVLITLVV